MIDVIVMETLIMLLGVVYILTWAIAITLIAGGIVMMLLTHLGFFVSILKYGGILLGLIGLTIAIFFLL